MVEISGTYKCEKNENLDDFMKANGKSIDNVIQPYAYNSMSMNFHE